MSEIKVKNIFILTGAGISAESGIPTFRGMGGLWEGYSIEEVASPEGFIKNPALVHQFYNQRRKKMLDCQPNAGHEAIARLQKQFKGEVFLVTQNIDDLHERAGSPQVCHMHGELLKIRCRSCKKVFKTSKESDCRSVCESCNSVGKLRPHIVWFGEMPLFMNEIEQALNKADVFVSIGTSGQVYPAAGFVQSTKYSNAKTIEINLEQHATSPFFDESYCKKAGEFLPEFLKQYF